MRVKRDCIHELVLTRGSEEILDLNNGIGRSSDLIEVVLQRIQLSEKHKPTQCSTRLSEPIPNVGINQVSRGDRW